MKIFKNPLSNLWRSPTNPDKPEPTVRKKPRWQNSAAVILVILFFVFLFFSRRTAGPQVCNECANQNQNVNHFENVQLEAKAAYVFDALKNQPIFEFNSEAQLPLASLTKIMTGLVAKETLPASLDVVLSQEAIMQEGDDGFLVGEKWPLSELSDVMLLASSNDAAFAIASEFNKDFNQDFVSLMNKKAKELGLAQTYFLNPTGLDISENYSGAYGSAKDIAKLFLYIVKNYPPLMEITRLDSSNINSRKFKNTNQVINELPGFIAGKTGFSDLAGGNLAIVADKGYGHPFAIVVLGSTSQGRFSDVKMLYNLIMKE